MDATKSTPFSALKSKKPPHSPSPSDQKTSKVSGPDLSPFAVKTPGKPLDPPRRSGRRTAVMSINQVRQAALELQERVSHMASRPHTSTGSGKEPVKAPKKKKKVDAKIKLPEKYQLLEEFFNCLASSYRLLLLKGSATNFTNIRLQVECLTDRRFSHGDLAQLKFIVPDALVLEKILHFDERTRCMKPDILVTLDFEACEKTSEVESHSKYSHLRKLFHGRLLDYFKSHPEGDDVPQEALPEPFNRVKEDASINSVQASTSSLISEMTDAALPCQRMAPSHLPPSFRMSFAQRALSNHTQDIAQLHSEVSVHVGSKSEFAGNLSSKEASAVAAKSPIKLSINKASPTSVASSPLPETPVKSNDKSLSSIGTPIVLRTPAEAVSTPAKFMTTTPMVNPPKRCYMSPDDNLSRSPSKLVKRPPANRPLKFDTPVKRVKSGDELGTGGNCSSDDDVLSILSPALLSSIREKEKKVLMELDPAISQAKRRTKMIANLPKFFDTVYFLFQSKQRSVLTKEELMHSVISENLQIVGRSEVQEQLTLLLELAPEWIYEKQSMSGDLVCINKISSPDSIRTRMLEAK